MKLSQLDRVNNPALQGEVNLSALTCDSCPTSPSTQLSPAALPATDSQPTSLLYEIFSPQPDALTAEDPGRLCEILLDRIESEVQQGELPALVLARDGAPWQPPTSKVGYLTSMLDLRPEDQVALQLAELRQWLLAHEPQPLHLLANVRRDYPLISPELMQASGLQSIARDHLYSRYDSSSPAHALEYVGAFHLPETVIFEEQLWRQTLTGSGRWSPADMTALVRLELDDDRRFDVATTLHDRLTDELLFRDGEYFGSALTNGAANFLADTAILFDYLPEIRAQHTRELELQAAMAFGSCECLRHLRAGQLDALQPLRHLITDLSFDPEILLNSRFIDELDSTLDTLLERALDRSDKGAFDAQESAIFIRGNYRNTGYQADLSAHTETALELVQKNLRGGDPFSAYLVGNAFELGAVEYLHPRTVGSAGWGALQHLANWGLPLAAKIFG